MSRPSSGSRSQREAFRLGNQETDSKIQEKNKNVGLSQQKSDSEASAAQGDSVVSKFPRPTSLYALKNAGAGESIYDFVQGHEREPLQFEVNLVGAPVQVEQLINNIKTVAQQFLYHWKTFPIILPKPIAQIESSYQEVKKDEIYETLSRKNKHNHLRDLFIAPSFDELDLVAVDSKGEPRKLTGKQLESIRERGSFEVDSINFPGQKHKWLLSQLLQKGVLRTKESLMNDLALALRFLLVTARGRIFSHFFSIAQSVKALIKGFLRILDLFLGVPSLQAHNLDAKIREERCKYLVAELVCRPENEESLDTLCTFVRYQLRRATTEKFEVARECAQPPVSVPYKYLTTAGAELDLRLWDRALMKKALPILIQILERETRGWFLHFRERLVAEMRAKKMPDQDIEKEVNEAVQKEYLERVYTSILSHPDLISLGEGVTQLLVNQAQSFVLMNKAVESVQSRLSKAQTQIKDHLNRSHPVLSRIAPWLRSQLKMHEKKFISENLWGPHEEALALCTSQRLNQTTYFLSRDLAFMKEREPALLRELRKVKIPTRNFHWPTQIWLPSNWIVRRNFQGQSEVVPTVLSSQVTSITTPRSDPSQPVFLVEKEVIRSTTTRWPFWRLINYFHRTWCWTWNAMFFFGIVLPWCSPIGLRALLSIEPFMPDLELSQINGTLFPRKSSITATLCSRLLSLWRHISKSRTHFETEPDTGFIGKGFTRHMNRIWNYVFKGIFGTMALILGFPLLCVTTSFLGVFVALTAWIWMPFLTLVVQISNAVIYDLDCPDSKRNRFFVIFEALIWNIGFLGLVQPLAAIFVAIILCPLISFCILTIGIVRYWLRLFWDATVFHLIIKNRGRIPASDSFVVKRIEGPGLTGDYFFQIRAEQALAAFEAKIELDQLSVYQHLMETKILQPQKDFAQFVEGCFGPFSAQLSKTGPYKTLEKEGQDLIQVLHEKLERRRRDLQTGLSVGVKSKIKLTTADLKIAIQQGALMLERFYPTHIFPYMGMTDEQFWENRGLGPNDWPGLASLLYSELFSLDILTPLDDSDTSFRLDTHPQADLERWTEMVNSAQLGVMGPDLLGNVYVPRGNIQIHSPYLEVTAFNPRSKILSHLSHGKSHLTQGNKESRNVESLADEKSNRKRTLNFSLNLPWKERQVPFAPDKLVIPLPVPHPTHIAITIYTRDTDDPIPLESEICQNILRGIEESPALPDDKGIMRFNASDSYETGSSSSKSESVDNLEAAATRISSETETTSRDQVSGYQWTLKSEWANRKRNNSGTIRVDLASPEDITLDTDGSKVIFSTYGTTV